MRTMKMNRWMLCLAGLMMAGGLSAAPVQLVHTPVFTGTVGEDLELQASLSGAPSDVHVRVYYRPKGKEIFRSLEMMGSASNLDATIPGEAVDEDGLEYYIEAATYGGGGKTVLATYPAMNAALSPVQVAVHVDNTPHDVTVLNPADGAIEDTTDPVVIFSFNHPDSAMDTSNVDVRVDGKSIVQSELDLDGSTCSVLLHNLSNGAHSVEVRVKDRAGNVSKTVWSFTVAASGSNTAATPSSWKTSGSVGLETAYGLVLQQPDSNQNATPFQPFGMNAGDLQVTTRNDTETLSLKVHATDLERTDTQPVDRFTGSWSDRGGTLTLGDISNATFTELTLWQLPELRGVEADLQSGPLDGNHSRFIGLWGETERAIPAGASNFSGVTSTATYAQYLYGARWESGGPHFQMGWNALTINDDAASVGNSVTAGVEPSYNSIVSADVKLASPEIHLALTGEGAVDYYSAAADPTGVSMGGSYRANALWDMVPWGTKASFEWRDLGGTLTDLSSKFGIAAVPIPGGYSTMGNPGLLSDYRGFESSASQKLFSNQFELDFNYDHWHDNLNSTKFSTTTTDYFSGAVSIAPTHWPSLNLGLTTNHAYNDADGTIAMPSNILNDSFSVGLGYSFQQQHTVPQDISTWNFNLNWNQVSLTDLDTIRSSPDLQGWNLVLVALYNHKADTFSVTAGLGQSNSPATQLTYVSVTSSTINPVTYGLGDQFVSNTNAGIHWMHQWDGSPVDTNFGWDLADSDSNSDGVTGMDPVPATSNTSLRNTYSGTGGYRLSKAQRLSLQLAYATVSGSVNTGTGPVSDGLTELYSDLRYDLNF
jgi:hypothetical protein